MRLWILLAMAIALLAVVFALQNNTVAWVHFLWGSFQAPLALILLGTLTAGIAIGLLVSVPAVVRRGWSVSRQTQQLSSLTEQLASKTTELTEQHQTHERQIMAQSATHQELLRALAVADPVTGLLQYAFLPQSVSYLIEKGRSGAPASVCLYLLLGQPSPDTPCDQATLQKAIAHVLRPQTTQQWLFTDGAGRFACLTVDVDGKAAAELGDRLRDTLLRPDAPGLSSLSLTVNVGGAIAHTLDKIDSPTLIQQAEAALDHALKRGRNRVRLVDANRP